LVRQAERRKHWAMESRSELKDIESIAGDVLSENKGKVGDVFQQINSIEMAAEKRKGQPITLRASSLG
jgi:hypothetical protein